MDLPQPSSPDLTRVILVWGQVRPRVSRMSWAAGVIQSWACRVHPAMLTFISWIGSSVSMTSATDSPVIVCRR